MFGSEIMASSRLNGLHDNHEQNLLIFALLPNTHDDDNASEPFGALCGLRRFNKPELT